MIDTLSTFAGRCRAWRATSEFEGRLGGQADVPVPPRVERPHHNVNELAGNLTGQGARDPRRRHRRDAAVT